MTDETTSSAPVPPSPTRYEIVFEASGTVGHTEATEAQEEPLP